MVRGLRGPHNLTSIRLITSSTPKTYHASCSAMSRSASVGTTALEEEGAARLMANFRWHGFAVSVRRLEPDAHGPAETLLAAAREEAALLVMRLRP